MGKYVPSGRFSVLGLLFVFGLSGYLSWLVGGIMGALSGLVWFFWFFPVAWGFVVGLTAGLGILLGKCRNTPLAVLAGILCSVLSYANLHLGKNNEFRDELKESLIKGGRATEKDADQAADRMIVRDSGKTGFWGVFALRARKGLIYPGRDGRKTPILWGWAAIAYWIFELALGTAFAIFSARYFARQPFCEDCRSWWKKDDNWEIRGNPDSLYQAIHRRDFSHLSKALISVKGADQLSIERCARCNRGQVLLTIRLRPIHRKDTVEKPVVEELLSEEEGRAFLAALPPAAAPSKPPSTGTS